MHYGDANQLAQSKLVVTIYKHATPDEGVFDYEITSISHCCYISIRLLKLILNEPNQYFEDAFKNLNAECWYSVTFTTSEDDFNLIIENIKDISETGDEMMRVH